MLVYLDRVTYFHKPLNLTPVCLQISTSPSLLNSYASTARPPCNHKDLHQMPLQWFLTWASPRIKHVKLCKRPPAIWKLLSSGCSPTQMIREWTPPILPRQQPLAARVVYRRTGGALPCQLSISSKLSFRTRGIQYMSVTMLHTSTNLELAGFYSMTKRYASLVAPHCAPLGLYLIPCTQVVKADGGAQSAHDLMPFAYLYVFQRVQEGDGASQVM